MRDVPGARHAIVDETTVQELAVLVEHFLVEGMTEALHHRALVLPLALKRVDPAADVGDRDVSPDAEGARLLVDGDLRGADRHLPERRAAAERRGAHSGSNDPAPDQLTPAHAEANFEQLAERNTLPVTDD